MSKPFRYGLFLLVTIFIINLIINFLLNFVFRGSQLFNNLNWLIVFLSSLLAALIISIVVIYTTPVIKDFLATYRTLLRLESLSHPLLMRLSTEAPGTYNHSLMVANLANKAAKAIGADSLLARVGGYYHDIGKLIDASLFIENQGGSDNIHEQMDSPQKSAKMIINHVKEGVKLAKEYKLPDELIALIAEHHGTTTLSYFYEKAREKNSHLTKTGFRYPGPKIMSREAAILMLADAIEAKIRLIKDVNPKIIHSIVEEIINARLDSKQLELSGLSAGDINRIKDSFVETLGVIFHQRIDYPKTGLLRYKL